MNTFLLSAYLAVGLWGVTMLCAVVFDRFWKGFFCSAVINYSVIFSFFSPFDYSMRIRLDEASYEMGTIDMKFSKVKVWTRKMVVDNGEKNV